MDTNLKTYPVLMDNDILSLKAFADKACKWADDFEAELRLLWKDLESRGYDGIDLKIIEEILG